MGDIVNFIDDNFAEKLYGGVSICPVCNGSGLYKEYGYGLTSVYSTIKTCHGCNGKGWVYYKTYNI